MYGNTTIKLALLMGVIIGACGMGVICLLIAAVSA